MTGHGRLPAEGSIVAIRFSGEAAEPLRFRVIGARAGAVGWAYLTGWQHGIDPVEQTLYVDLAQVTTVEPA